MVKKIEQKIIGYKVLNENDLTENIEIVHEELKRPNILKGTTYKIKPMGYDSALYMTINDICMNAGTEHEQKYPYEIFLNSKQMESYQWIATMTRLVSAIFRKGGNITFIVDELEQIFDPKGGYWGKEPGGTKGKFYNSVVGELGSIIKQHMIEIGLIKAVKNISEEKKEKVTEKKSSVQSGQIETGVDCPECNEPNMQLMDGCYTCVNGCGFSKCG